MNAAKKTFLILLMLTLVLALPLAKAQAKDYKLTAVAGHPPIFLWVGLIRDYFIPEVDKRLAETGNIAAFKDVQADQMKVLERQQQLKDVAELLLHPLQDEEILRSARESARDILAGDPELNDPSHRTLRS